MFGNQVKRVFFSLAVCSGAMIQANPNQQMMMGQSQPSPLIMQGPNAHLMQNQMMQQQMHPSQMMGMDPSLADPQMNLGMHGSGMMMEPDAPGVVNPLSIRALIDNANSHVNPQQLGDLTRAVQAYVDGNLTDAREMFSNVTNKYGESVATDRAYLGLAKIERAYGAYDVSRRILEAVIRKNRDYESIMLARRAYQDLEREVNQAVGQSQMAMEAANARYESIGWLNVFQKIRAYNEYKDAKANYEGLLISSRQFDAVFTQANITVGLPSASLEPVKEATVPAEIDNQIDSALQLPSGLQPSANPVPQPMVTSDNLHGTGLPWNTSNATPNNVVMSAATPTAAPVQAATLPAPATAQPEVVLPKELPNMSLDEARVAYTQAYEELRKALSAEDPVAKKAAQEKYQSALETYNLIRANN